VPERECSGSVAPRYSDAQLTRGAHAWNNITAACSRCNSRKFSLSLLTFLLYAPQIGQGDEPER
jgi:5-methylcytosine-specific restriction endonuclease McrA